MEEVAEGGCNVGRCRTSRKVSDGVLYLKRSKKITRQVKNMMRKETGETLERKLEDIWEK